MRAERGRRRGCARPLRGAQSSEEGTRRRNSPRCYNRVQSPTRTRSGTDVATNLAANRLRLLIISDRIPDELARVVTFLNKQMSDIEVFAIEIKRFKGSTNQTLVPRVIGRTTEGAKSKRGDAGKRVTRESFLEGFADERVRTMAECLVAAAQDRGCQNRVWQGRSKHPREV